MKVLPPPKALSTQCIHLWAFSATHPLRQYLRAHSKTYLTPAEHQAFMANQPPQYTRLDSRCILRWLLQHYYLTNQAANTIQLHYQTTGKPTLPKTPNLHFNLSHNNHYLVLAFAQYPLGIDIEQIVPRTHHRCTLLAKKILHPDERHRWERLPHPQQHSALYDAWTRKEALIKCEGLSLFPWLNKLPLYWPPHPVPWHTLPPPLQQQTFSGFHSLMPQSNKLCCILKTNRHPEVLMLADANIQPQWF
jgi:phosphopantetheinyl transferase